VLSKWTNFLQSLKFASSAANFNVSFCGGFLSGKTLVFFSAIFESVLRYEVFLYIPNNIHEKCKVSNLPAQQPISMFLSVFSVALTCLA
jgi:hypothetical protein